MVRFLWVVAAFGFVGCGGDAATDGTTSSSENCTTDWTCENGVCECADGTSCADETECDAVCEVCT